MKYGILMAMIKWVPHMVSIYMDVLMGMSLIKQLLHNNYCTLFIL